MGWKVNLKGALINLNLSLVVFGFSQKKRKLLNRQLGKHFSTVTPPLAIVSCMCPNFDIPVKSGLIPKFGTNNQHCSWSPFRPLTGNNNSGPLFSPFFSTSSFLLLQQNLILNQRSYLATVLHNHALNA